MDAFCLYATYVWLCFLFYLKNCSNIHLFFHPSIHPSILSMVEYEIRTIRIIWIEYEFHIRIDLIYSISYSNDSNDLNIFECIRIYLNVFEYGSFEYIRIWIYSYIFELNIFEYAFIRIYSNHLNRIQGKSFESFEYIRIKIFESL